MRNFWTKDRQIEELKKQLAEKSELLEKAQSCDARAAWAAAYEVETLYHRTPAIVTEGEQKRVNMQRLLVLAGLSSEDPLWNTVLGYADEHARNEAQVALRPGLTDGERQYNAGRAASADDFATALRDLRLKAEREGRNPKS